MHLIFFLNKTGRNPKAPGEVLRLFAESGGNLDRLVMCHLGSELDFEI